MQQDEATSDASKVTKLTHMLLKIKRVSVPSFFDAPIFDLSETKPFSLHSENVDMNTSRFHFSVRVSPGQDCHLLHHFRKPFVQF